MQRTNNAVPDPGSDVPADGPSSTDTAASQAERPAQDLIPGWLALTVLLLLLVVAALGGYILRGVMIGSAGQTPADIAVAEWQRAVDTNPEDPESLLGLGYAYQQRRDYDQALAAYESVLTADPGNTGALYNIGAVYREMGRGKDAEVAFWDVLEVAPDHALAAKALGEYYIASKQYKSALAALEPVIETRPHFADLQYLAGYSCEQLGLQPQAIEYYRGALMYAPDYAEAREGLRRLGEEG